MSESNSQPTVLDEHKAYPPETAETDAKNIRLVLGFDVDLPLLRRQKRALIGVYEGATVSYEQEEAAEGLLNLIDFIQDSVLEQGLASEEEIFPQPPQLFRDEPVAATITL
jgi:hypothetical protein